MKNGEYELVVAPKGYPGKRYRGRYAYEHHVEAWRKTGKNPTGKVVHHKNGSKRDNSHRNIEMTTEKEHKTHHGHHQNEDRARRARLKKTIDELHSRIAEIKKAIAAR